MKNSTETFIALTLGIVIIIFLSFVIYHNKHKEHFLSGENAYMEPEFDYYFAKCLQSYPIAFRGPINDGYYTCLRKTEAALKGLGQGCEFCYNRDR